VPGENTNSVTLHYLNIPHGIFWIGIWPCTGDIETYEKLVAWFSDGRLIW
jgi:hypothetical protein